MGQLTFQNNPFKIKTWVSWILTAFGASMHAETTLQFAAWSGNIGAIEELLNQGNDVDAQHWQMAPIAFSCLEYACSGC
jgi:hypothetical protein